MSTLAKSYSVMTQINLWYKLQSGDSLKISDIPTLIPLRWQYFRDNWEFIKPDIIKNQSSYADPDFLDSQISDFSSFIQSQRSSSSKLNPFSDATIVNKFYAIFDNTNLTGIALTNEEVRIVEDTNSKTLNLSKNDFLDMKSTLREYRDRYSDKVDLSDSDYNGTYERSSIPAQSSATIVDANYMLELNKGLESVDFILANYFANEAAIDLFVLAKTNANNPQVNIGQYSSGRLVKIEYGEDLQNLAYRYLGNPDKWIDIAIANGLKPPYIDEVGERLPLMSNANGNQLNIAGTDNTGNLNIDKFYINQVIQITSDTEVAIDQRKIVNIRQIPVSNEIVIEVDGASDLIKYQIADNARIRVFKPNTVNSNIYTLIPSTDPASDTRKEDTPWFLANAAEDEKQTLIDLAVNESGDLIISPNGDLKLSYGLDNAIQALKLRLSTELGTSRMHPTYGIIDSTGNKNNDLDSAQTSLTQSIISQIQSDPRFERVETFSIDYDNAGTTASKVNVNMSVRLAGGGGKVIPISFSVSI